MAEAEAELEERGPAAFSLRAVAKRAGVSHAAPAHHFGDARGLLTALAARGYERLCEAQEAAQAGVGRDPRERLAASGLGYVRLARERPAVFAVMFDVRRLDWENEPLRAAAEAALDRLAREAAAVSGRDVSREEGLETLRIAWSVAHGTAALLNGGHLVELAAMEPAERDRAILAMFRRALG